MYRNVRLLFQPLVSIKAYLFTLFRCCHAQIPNSDVGNYPSGVLTLITAIWLFFSNSTSTLYGMLPQYWLMPGLQTAGKQRRDDRKRVKCCPLDCYNENPDTANGDAYRLLKEFLKHGVDLRTSSAQIVAAGSWSFAALAEASNMEVDQGKRILMESRLGSGRLEQSWLDDFESWMTNVSDRASRFWVHHHGNSKAEVLAAHVTMRTVDVINVRVGSRRRTMIIRDVACLLTHSVAASAARERQRCVVYEAILVSIWAGVAQHPNKGTAGHGRQWDNPVIVSASTLRLRALTPPPGLIIPFEPIETHALWVYIVLITFARVSVSSATALGSSGSLWFAVFTGLYLTNSSAAGSFGRENYDARADSGFMSGAGFYLNFSRSTMTKQVRLHDRLESVSVVLSLVCVVAIRLFKLRLRYLLGYGTWVSSAPWQMIPGVLLSFWAAAIYIGELLGHFRGFSRSDSVDIPKAAGLVVYKSFVLLSCLACICLGSASIITAYQGAAVAVTIRWITYAIAEFHSWHVGFYQFAMDKVDGPDMWFAASSTLAAMWGAALLAVAADEGSSLLWN